MDHFDGNKQVEVSKGYFENGSFRVMVDFIDKERKEIRDLEIILPKDSWYFDVMHCKQLTAEAKVAIQLDLERYAEQRKEKYKECWQDEAHKQIRITAEDLGIKRWR